MRIPFLSRLFKKTSQAEKPKPGVPRSISHSPRDINRLLLQCVKDNSLLDVDTGSSEQQLRRATTGINSVDIERRVIYVDTFKPEAVNRNVSPGDRVRFSLNYLGVRTHFDCVLKETADTPHIEHTFEFPRGIERTQLRDAYRLRISAVNPVRVTLENADKNTWSGLVSDLSVTGARVKIRKLLQPEPQRGDEYPHCYVTLSDGQRVACGARLIHWSYDPHKDITIIGICFIDLESRQELKLNRFLTDLQRKEMGDGAIS